MENRLYYSKRLLVTQRSRSTSARGDEQVKDLDKIVFQPIRNVSLPFRYLHLSGDTYGRPIQGQKEISATSYANNQNLWKVDAGVYIRPSSEPLSSTRDENSRQSSTSHQDHFDDEL